MDISTSPKALVLNSIASGGFPLDTNFRERHLAKLVPMDIGSAGQHQTPEIVSGDIPLARDDGYIHLLARETTFQIRKKELENEKCKSIK
jgi:hypothetical protein